MIETDVWNHVQANFWAAKELFTYIHVSNSFWLIHDSCHIWWSILTRRVLSNAYGYNFFDDDCLIEAAVAHCNSYICDILCERQYSSVLSTFYCSALVGKFMAQSLKVNYCAGWFLNDVTCQKKPWPLCTVWELFYSILSKQCFSNLKFFLLKIEDVSFLSAFVISLAFSLKKHNIHSR